MYNVIDLDSYKKDCSIQYSYRQGPCFDDCMCEMNKGLKCEEYSRWCLCVNKDLYWSQMRKCVYALVVWIDRKKGTTFHATTIQLYILIRRVKVILNILSNLLS